MNEIYSKRKDDIVISLIHDKANKSLTIKHLNEEAMKVLESAENQVINQPFTKFIDDYNALVIEEFLKDDSDWTSLESVISKISEFYLKTASNKKIRVKLKAIPRDSSDYNNLEFELLIRNLSRVDQFTEFKIANDFTAEVRHEQLNVIDYDKNLDELKLMMEFVHKNSIECVICQISIEEKDEFYNPNNDLKNIIEILKMQIREDDIIGIKNHVNIIFVLLDCPQNHAKNIAERIYGAIKAKINIKLCITYFPITNKVSLENILNDLENTSQMLLK